MHNEDVLSHTPQKEALFRLQKINRLPHSIMLVGPSGVGKYLLAKTLAKIIFCNNRKSLTQFNSCGECKSCHLIASGTHPDLYLIDCSDKENVSVDSIRELLNSIQMKPFIGGERVVIFNDVEKLSVTAANILLKTLEEPLSGTYFILVVENSAKLPSTVLSRCQKWFFASLDDESMRKILTDRYEIAADRLDALVEVLDGSLGDILSILDHTEKYEELSQRFDRILRGDLVEAINLASAIHKDKDGLEASLKFLLTIARKKMKIESDPNKSFHLSLYLSNIISAHSYIKDRNINSFYILQVIFEELILGFQGKSSSPLQISELMI